MPGIASPRTDPTPDNPNARSACYLVAKDDATAAEKLATVKTLLGLAGLSGQRHHGCERARSRASTVTTVTVTDLGALVPPGSVPGVDAGSLDTPGLVLDRGPRPDHLPDRRRRRDGRGPRRRGRHEPRRTTPPSSSRGQRGLANSKTTVYVAVGATLDLVQGFCRPR